MLRKSYVFIALLYLACCTGAWAASPEVRAIWVSRFEWPSSNETTAKNNIDTIMATAAANHFNTVLFQVRGQCDVHYPSPYEPWSDTYGWTNPGWDPLAYAIQKAHENGLEFHAYMNTHTLAQPVPPANTTPQHMYNLHGPSVPAAQSWMIRTAPDASAGLVDGYYWISPGIPEASAWTRQAIMHVVKNYDVDGVHFDRIRCPGNSYSHDPITEARFAGDGNPDGLPFSDFMRSQITRDLRNLYGEIAYYKPNVKTSAAPFGIVYKDATTHYQGTGTQSYHQWYQDSWGWLDSHVLDFMVPQIYWEVGSSHPFELLLQDWMEHTGGRFVVAGSTTNGGGKTVSALLAEHEQTRLLGAQGHTIFSYSSMGAYWNSFLTQRYQETAPIPEMPWKTAPTAGIITGYVVDQTGHPVVDAKINRVDDSYNYLSAYDGFFSMLDVAPGTTHSLTASKNNVGRKTVGSVVVSAGNVTSLTLVLSNSQGAISLDHDKYAPNSTAEIVVSDGDLAGQSEVTVEVASTTDSTSETVMLAADGPSGNFKGTIQLESVSANPGDGILQVQEGDLLEVGYLDEDNGDGASAVVTDSAIVDGTGPVISNVNTGSVVDTAAAITFDTDEPATATVYFGTTCGNLNQQGTITTLSNAHSVGLAGLTPLTTYYYQVEARDEAGNSTTEDNGGTCFSFTTTEAVSPDWFTQSFDGLSTLFDLSNLSLTLTPNGSANFYKACLESAPSFPTDSTGGTNITLSDDSSTLVSFTGGQTFPFYGTSYTGVYVGSNGYVTFGASDSDYSPSITDHFAKKRIAALFRDLNPSGQGTISRRQLADRFAVTYSNVPAFGTSNSNNFQIELFFNGTIRVTWLDVASTDGIAGISAGTGTPAG